jgi:hypothetical protein
MNLNLETELHQRFKAAVALDGKNMTDVLVRFIRDYVEGQEAETVKKRKTKTRH